MVLCGLCGEDLYIHAVGGLAQRYKVERKFGEGKTGHGLARCRYIGLVKYAIQSFLTAMVLNLKRLVRILTGVTFKGRATALG
jgi:IS5 family transposase